MSMMSDMITYSEVSLDHDPIKRLVPKLMKQTGWGSAALNLMLKFNFPWHSRLMRMSSI